MKINYHNIPVGRSKFNFLLRYIMNIIRTWYLFHFKYPWVKYNGFVRIMPHTSFAKMDISIGNNVQFGNYCNVASNVKFGNYILIAEESVLLDEMIIYSLLQENIFGMVKEEKTDLQ